MKTLQVDVHFVGFENESYNVFSDQKRIQQVFLNILSNAVKFTDRDGKIMILVEYQRRPKEGIDADFVMISITDSGCGIKKKN